MAGEWHETDEMVTNDSAVNVVTLNGDMPTLKPIASLMFQVSPKAFRMIDDLIGEVNSRSAGEPLLVETHPG